MKKTIAIIMILGLIFTLLSGCSKKKDKEEEKDITTDNKVGMGRYVEEGHCERATKVESK